MSQTNPQLVVVMTGAMVGISAPAQMSLPSSLPG
jgi:hypothetical protein